MPRFFYKAKKGPSELIEGEIDAENEESALAKIVALGLTPLKLDHSSKIAKGPSTSTPSVAFENVIKTPEMKDLSKVRISSRELNIFTRQFSILLRANVPLLRIFEVLQSQTQNDKFHQVLKEAKESLREGGSLSEVLGGYPRIFSKVYLSMLHSGEISGTLDTVLGRLAGFAEKEDEIRSRVKAALVYPVFLLLTGVATIFILFTFVMPRLLVLFDDLGTELPAITQWMMTISRFCQGYWMYIVGAVVVLTVWFRMLGLSPAQKKLLDQFLVKLPVFGELVKKSEIARFLRSLELLYENGIPLFRAVEVAIQTIGNAIIRGEMENVPTRLEGGETLAKSLEGVSYLSVFVTNMVSVGEESGQLGSAVGETASFFEQETNQFIKMALSLLEPLMILSVGIVVGFIVVAMLLPIFEIHVFAQ